MAIASLVLLLAGCSGPQSALDPAGSQAGRISSLWWLYLSVCTAVYGAVILFLFIAAFRRRPHKSDAPVLVDPDERRERRFTGVITWAVVGTAVILFVFMIADFQTGRALASLGSSADTNALTVKITGRQWWWEIEYSDPVPSNIVKTANELHLPVGRPVKFELQSVDVIHSFWVPNLHGKRDLIPGYKTTTWLEAERPGTYFGQCAEFCGHQHAHMRFIVVAESEGKFSSWLSSQRQPASPPSTPSQKRGQEIFLNGTCIMCHTVQGTDARATVGPNLTHIASRPMIAAGTRPNTRDQLARWILNPHHTKPGVRMPVHNFNPADLQALLDYLQSLK